MLSIYRHITNITNKIQIVAIAASFIEVSPIVWAIFVCAIKYATSYEAFYAFAEIVVCLVRGFFCPCNTLFSAKKSLALSVKLGCLVFICLHNFAGLDSLVRGLQSTQRTEGVYLIYNTRENPTLGHRFKQ